MCGRVIFSGVLAIGVSSAIGLYDVFFIFFTSEWDNFSNC